MIEHAVELAVELARRFEGFYATAYLCPAGVPTIGYGFTRYEDGSAVTLLDPPMAKPAAERLLRRLIAQRYLVKTMHLCPNVYTPERLAALTDFCFNLGDGNLRASTLRRKVNDGLWDEVPDQLRRWCRGGGRVLRGLVLRREAEAKLV